MLEPEISAPAMSCWLYSQSPYRRQACAALALCCSATEVALWRNSSVPGRLLLEAGDWAPEETAALPVASVPWLSVTEVSAGVLSCDKSRKASAWAAALKLPAAKFTCEG